MGRNIEIDARRGGGAAHEILFGDVTIQATALHQDGTKTVFPDDTTIGISNGLAVLENVDVSPAGPEPAWAYKMTFRNHQTGRGWTEMVGVPAGSGPVKYPALTRFTTTLPPETTKAELQSWVATTEAAKNTAVQAAATATAPTDATMADKIGTKGTLTETALTAAIGESVAPIQSTLDGRLADAALKLATLRLETPTATGFDALALRTFRAAVAARDTAPVNIWCQGDSITGGGVAGSRSASWVPQLVAALRAKFPVAGSPEGGLGWLSANPDNSYSPVVRTGSGSIGTGLWSPDMHAFRPAVAGDKEVFSFTGTGADIMYITLTGGGTFYWKVDGGAATNVDTNADYTQTGSVVQIRGLVRGAHTVEVGFVTAGTAPPIIGGLMAYDGDEAKGFRYIMAGIGGATTTFWDTLTDRPYHWAKVYSPDLVVIALGTNDYYHGSAKITATAYKANLKSIIAKFKTNAAPKVPSFLLLLPALTNAVGNPLSPWIDFKGAAHAVAADDYQNVTVLDYGFLMNPEGTVTTADGLMGADLVHPTAAGHQFVGEVVARYVGVV